MIRWIGLFLISTSIYAAPKDIEVWFVSHAKTALLMELLNRPNTIYSKPVVQLECQPMGDYCFDPQYGLYKKDDGFNEVAPNAKLDSEGPQIATGKSVERELIDCDKGNFFDVFCGKARKEEKQNAKLDLWIDTSSSMREFDYSDKSGGCHRKSLVRALDQSCGFNQKVNVMMFDTSIKQAGSMDQLCDNRGLNDYKRLIDWIERADVPKLVIITDIYEFHKEFSDYIESKSGKLRGDKDALTAKDLVELADELAKSCK